MCIRDRDLNGPHYDSLKIIQDKVALAVSKAGPGEWVFGCGFVDSNIKELAAEGRLMNRWDLDPVSGKMCIRDRPIRIMMHHSRWIPGKCGRFWEESPLIPPRYPITYWNI